MDRVKSELQHRSLEVCAKPTLQRYPKPNISIRFTFPALITLVGSEKKEPYNNNTLKVKISYLLICSGNFRSYAYCGKAEQFRILLAKIPDPTTSSSSICSLPVFNPRLLFLTRQLLLGRSGHSCPICRVHSSGRIPKTK